MDWASRCVGGKQGDATGRMRSDGIAFRLLSMFSTFWWRKHAGKCYLRARKHRRESGNPVARRSPGPWLTGKSAVTPWAAGGKRSAAPSGMPHPLAGQGIGSPIAMAVGANQRKGRMVTTVYPCAKINLGLSVVERRPDGYHNLETVFYPLGLRDELSIEPLADAPAGVGCRLVLGGDVEVEGSPDGNTVNRAYALLKGLFPDLPPVCARLTKRIPSKAGMGGGSSDGAFALVALNRMFGLGLSMERLRDLALGIGADCAFFVDPVPSYATGVGERLSRVPLDLGEYAIAVVRPPIPVSTREAFSRIRPKAPARNCRQVVMQPVPTWRGELVNDFERSVFALHPEIGRIKEGLYSLGALYASMTGSGSAVFGIFATPPDGLEGRFPGCFTAVVR